MTVESYTEKSEDPWGLLKAGVDVRRASLIRKCLGKSGVVLDAGCGFGIYSNFLDSLGNKTIGLDASKRMVSDGKVYFKKMTFVAGRGERLPFKPESFDAVLCMGALIYSRYRKKFLSELNRVTKPAGKLCLIERNRASPMHSMVRKMKRNENPVDNPDDFFTKTELKKLVSDAGFKTTKISGDQISLPVFSKFTHKAAEIVPSAAYFLVFECEKA